MQTAATRTTNASGVPAVMSRRLRMSAGSVSWQTLFQIIAVIGFRPTDCKVLLPNIGEIVSAPWVINHAPTRYSPAMRMTLRR